MRIEWSQALETGHRTIDLQHQELVGMINELRDANPLQISQLALDDMLQRLDGYIAFHFGTEESLMARLPAREAHASEHLRQHRLFSDQVAQLRAVGGDNVAQTLHEIADFLSEWLYQHILKTDCQLAQLLNGMVKLPDSAKAES